MTPKGQLFFVYVGICSLAKKIKKIYEVNGIVVVSIIDVEDGNYG
ncbi:probable protein (plasmid) [Bacillus thuringiensis serovar tolworthi]|uniref:Probable protein n=1 Tax=Bacillus thuringiensis subsp. tolworthi TaxID=1442 RepID=A0A9W4ABH5_BACTO|nr:probable protein [Bacillus thuringiensis serovar tolworthi]